MALRRFLFQNLALGSGYFDSSQDSDDLNLNSLAIKMASGTGTALDLNTNDIANVRKVTFLTGVGGAVIDGGGQRASNFGTPTQTGDLVTKAYADALQTGLDWKQSVRAGTTANVTVANPGTAVFDGVTLSNGDRLLLKNQTSTPENGIYVFNGSGVALTRAADATAGLLTSGAAVFITEGTANGATGWLVTTPDPITVGTTGLTWVQFTALGQITAGNGLTKTGATIDVVAGDGIAVAADSVAANIDANAGLQFDASSPKKIQLKLNGTTLQVEASGLSVLGVPAAGTWQIGGSATSANVTAANLNTLTAGSASNADSLHTHTGLGVSAPTTGVTVTAGAGGLSKGDPVYLSANNTCLKGDPSNVAKSVIVGVVQANISAAAQGVAQRDGILAGVGSGWTFGQQIWMSNTGGMTNDSTSITSRYRTIQLGIAMNATDLLVDIVDYGVKP